MTFIVMIICMCLLINKSLYRLLSLYDSTINCKQKADVVCLLPFRIDILYFPDCWMTHSACAYMF